MTQIMDLNEQKQQLEIKNKYTNLIDYVKKKYLSINLRLMKSNFV